ncbi:MAG TPA: helix-turn-helix transcriptional regulator [Mycobacterium sp.]|jgi:transcriptional regulator with XRE-family HTH domain
MENRGEVRDFLASRRARITPERAGLPVSAGSRRVPGLRRGEVATLAGVSVEYYTRIERGNLRGVSDSVLQAIAHALRLDDAERTHLFDLAHATGPGTTTRRRRARQRIRPGLQRILDAMTDTPATVHNSRLDILAANCLGYALFSDVFADPQRPANHIRFIFLDPRSHDFYPDWQSSANDAVAVLRAEAGHDPYDQTLTNLIGELSTRSDEFRNRWAAHNVRQHRTGTKRLHHRVVGDLELEFERLDVTADPGLVLQAYSADPGSSSHDALSLLASWAATRDQENALPTAERTTPPLSDRHEA